MSIKNTYYSRPVNPHREDAVKKFSGNNVLDVGCGNGSYVYRFMREKNILGVDYQSFDSWKHAPEHFSISDALNINFNDGSFDTVLAFEVLEHIKDYDAALKEMYRVCRNNIIVTVPNCIQTEGMKKSNILYGHYSDRTHINFWDMSNFCDVISNAGFEVVVAEHINFIDLSGIIMEAIQFNGMIGKIARKLIKLLIKKKYPMTLLVVANKK